MFLGVWLFDLLIESYSNVVYKFDNDSLLIIVMMKNY